jgi:phage tail sheath protein FI
MAELLSSKVVFQEEEPAIRTFPTLPTAVLAIQGIAEMGPVMVPTLITSFEEFQATFGSLLANYELALAVRAYFLQGGRQCYVSRVVHLTNYLTDKTPATAAKGSATLQTSGGAASAAEVTGTAAGPTWEFQSGDTLAIKIDQAAPLTATFTGTPAEEESGAETYDLSTGGETLLVKIDRGSTQTVTFQTSMFGTPSAATAVEVAAAINAQLSGAKSYTTTGDTVVRIESDKKGTDSYVEVTGGTANGELAFPTSEVQGGGNVADIKAVTGAEIKTVVELAVAGSVVTTTTGNFIKLATVDTGTTAYIQVDAAGSTLETVLGLATTEFQGSDSTPQDTLKMEGTWVGAYANDYKIKITDASSGVASEFNLYVMKGTDVIETYANITMDDTETRYAITVINNEDAGSLLFTSSDEGATGSPTVIRPANTSGATVSGGDDGLTAIDANDWIGSEGGQTGLYAFDAADDVTLLCCPDETSSAVQTAIGDYCGDHRNGLIFGILDPVAGNEATDMINTQLVGITTAYKENVGLYWPGVKIVNPSKTVYGDSNTITVRPSGHIAGVMARNDRDEGEGPFYQPAGVEGGKPSGVVDVETDEVKLEPKRDLVFPKRINPISYLQTYGVFIDGARTLKGDGNFPSIGERRGVSHIERLLQSGLQWVRHRNNTPDLREDVETQVFAMLFGWMQKGAFASKDPNTAFFVDVSDALNPPSSVRAGKLVMRIGLATNSPAEFVIIKITKDTRALQEEIFSTST